MPPTDHSADPQSGEIEDFRRRLDEAEELMRAIRNGEIDAFIVPRPEGDKVFALSTADRPYRILIEQMQQGAVILTRDGLISYANSYVQQLLHCPFSLVGKSFSEFVPTCSRQQFQSLVELALTGGSHGEVLLTDCNGSELPVLLALNQLPPEEEVPGFCLTIANLTDQRKARAALEEANITLERRVEERTAKLRESAERFRFLAESMPQKIFTAQPDGAVDYFNAQWMAFTGLSFEQIRGWGWKQFIHPEDLEDTVGKWLGAVRTGQSFQMEHRFRRFDGEYRWHLSRAEAMLDERRNTVMWIGSNTDIHDQKQLEEQLKQADRRKDEFLATVSHELRTPLTAMLGWIRLLRQGKLDAGSRDRALEVIDRNVTVQTQLIEDLLDVSRIITGKMKLNIDLVDMVKVTSAAIESVQMAAQAKKIGIRTEVAPIRLMGDSSRLQQVLWNLLSNAIKFTPPGGNITIWLRNVRSQAQIGVEDTGVGIKPEFLPRVFDRFAQADSSSSRRSGGLGIGLAIVRHLIELHGGTVGVESPGEGKGATFLLHIPIQAVAAVHDPAAMTPHSASMLQGLRVLIVDDEADTRELLKTVLTTGGAVCAAASGADEGFEKIKHFRPEVLVSDISMPGQDGFDFIRKVRTLAPDAGGKTPAIALSAYARDEDRTLSLTAGFQMHLQKPIDPLEFVKALTRLAGRQS